jgi:hypothetical protein
VNEVVGVASFRSTTIETSPPLARHRDHQSDTDHYAVTTTVSYAPRTPSNVPLPGTVRGVWRGRLRPGVQAVPPQDLGDSHRPDQGSERARRSMPIYRAPLYGLRSWIRSWVVVLQSRTWVLDASLAIRASSRKRWLGVTESRFSARPSVFRARLRVPLRTGNVPGVLAVEVTLDNDHDR